MEPIDVVRRGREIISDQKRWTKFAFAKKADGGHTLPRSSDAVAFCAIGVIDMLCKAEDWNSYFEAHELLNDAALRLFGCVIQTVNDKLGHASVLAMFDEVIGKEEGNG